MKTLIIRNLKGQFVKGSKPMAGFKKGNKPIAGFKKGLIPWNKGLEKEKNPLYGVSRSKETKKKISIKNKGKIISKETKSKMSKAKKGKKFTKEHRKNLSKAQIKRYDKVGRKKYKRYIHVRDKKYLQWRLNVFKRDNWTCQKCGKRGCYLEAHHIKSWKDYPKLRYKLNNGQTLCLSCHKLTKNYKNKIYV